jgi:hypothetical protein
MVDEDVCLGVLDDVGVPKTTEEADCSTKDLGDKEEI